MHLHTEYSLLDGFARQDKLFLSLKEKGMKAVAITDHGSMFGVVEFYRRAKEYGIKAIIGCEIYVCPDGMLSQSRERNHLILLAKNASGYRNLSKICSIGYTEGFYYKPRVDLDVLRKYSDGIICLSGCKYGSVSSALVAGDVTRAETLALELREIYSEDFYLEMQFHGDPDELVINRGMIYISKRTGIPLVATNDVHYVEKKDAKVHDILLCVQTNKQYSDPNRMKFFSDEFYLKSPEEMWELFHNCPEAIENTVKIAGKCEFEFDFESKHLPKFTKKLDLRTLCYEKLNAKIAEGVFRAQVEEIRARLEYELEVIETMGYADYMLIVQDFITAARSMNIAVGPGRGSAGGSLVTFLLDITEVNPIEHRLIFERFLNPERVTMPDIDVDFEDERRAEVIDYVRNLYGNDRVSNISTFGTFAARAAIRDVGRVLGEPSYLVDRLARAIPSFVNLTKARTLPEVKKIIEENPELETLYSYATELEGIPRHVSTHAAGVVITEEPVSEYVPLCQGYATQYTMGALADLGMLKMDFLGIRTLSVIKHALERIKERTGMKPGIDEQREEVYRLLRSGHTIGLFQLESTGFRRFIREVKPKKLDDIVAAISLYRPGPMQHIDRYLQNQGVEHIAYDIPELAPILDETNGVIIYQEQVMTIARNLAGYTYGRSDVLRNAMSKKKKHIMEQEKPVFIEGMAKNGIDRRKAEALFEDLTEFANYAFNKTHAVGYAILAYRTAYLKTFHPLEFMAALLTSVINDKNLSVKYINECKRMGIKLLPPCINHSRTEFAIEGDAVRWSLVSIKHVGESLSEAVVEKRKERPFTDFFDFVERMPSSELRKNQIETMIQVGVFDCFGHTRTQLVAQYEQILKYVIDKRKQTGENQLNFFGSGVIPKPPLYPMREYTSDAKAAYEKEFLGVYLSDHPLDRYRELAEVYSNMSFSELLEEEHDAVDGKIYKGIVFISKKTEKYTKKGDLMAVFVCDDGDAEVEFVVFPKLYRHYQGDDIVYFEGTIQASEGREPNILASKMIPADKIRAKSPDGSGLTENRQHKKPGDRAFVSGSGAANLHAASRRKEYRNSSNDVEDGRNMCICHKILEISFSRHEKVKFEKADAFLRTLAFQGDEEADKEAVFEVHFILKETRRTHRKEGVYMISEDSMQMLKEIVGEENLQIIV